MAVDNQTVKQIAFLSKLKIEESKLEEKLQALTAQQRIQSIVVSVMPFIMMAVMFLFQPTQMINFYTSYLFTTF